MPLACASLAALAFCLWRGSWNDLLFVWLSSAGVFLLYEHVFEFLYDYLRWRRDARRAERIDPRIAGLVEALNRTRLVETFSSCEGHFEERELTGECYRGYASVLFRLRPEVKESDLRQLFFDLDDAYQSLRAHLQADLEITRKFIWHDAPVERDDSFYAIKIRPRRPKDAPRAKRRAVDDLIRLATGVTISLERPGATGATARDGHRDESACACVEQQVPHT